jgi:Xaa-Pro aminopeptidase
MVIGIEMKPIGFDKPKLLAQMKERGVGGILLTSSENVFYTTGFPALPSAGNPILYSLRNRRPFFSYIANDGRETLCCWGFAAEGMSFGANQVRGFDTTEQAISTISSLVKESLDSKTPLGIESTCPFYVTESLQTAGAAREFVKIDRIMENLRLIKSPEEVARIKKSTEIIEATMTELMEEVIHIGMSRLELIQEGKTRLFRNGGTGISHATFAFGIYNPEIAIGERLEEGKLITLDLGGIYEGYVSDTRRYVYVGSIDPAIAELHPKMVDIVERVGAGLVPGRRLCDAYQDALGLFRDYGLPARFISIGHSIGLETEEVWITKDEDRIIEPGMVINVELYSDVPGGEHVGDEETFVVEQTGPRRISSLPQGIHKIR